MPLVFKVLLLLAMGLRLVKTNKKKKNELSNESFWIDIKAISGEKIKFSPANEKSNYENLKQLFRDYVRPQMQTSSLHNLSIYHQLIAVGYFFCTSFERGKVGRFLWHKNDFTLSFYQLLHLLELPVEKEHYQAIFLEILNEDIENYIHDHKKWDSLNTYPTFTAIPTSFKTFDDAFQLETFSKKVINYCTINLPK